MDLEREEKIEGERFKVMKGKIESIEREIGKLMIDIKKKEKGYKEVMKKMMVREEEVYGKGKLKKF